MKKQFKIGFDNPLDLVFMLVKIFKLPIFYCLFSCSGLKGLFVVNSLRDFAIFSSSIVNSKPLRNLNIIGVHSSGSSYSLDVKRITGAAAAK